MSIESKLDFPGIEITSGVVEKFTIVGPRELGSEVLRRLHVMGATVTQVGPYSDQVMFPEVDPKRFKMTGYIDITEPVTIGTNARTKHRKIPFDFVTYSGWTRIITNIAGDLVLLVEDFDDWKPIRTVGQDELKTWQRYKADPRYRSGKVEFSREDLDRFREIVLGWEEST